MNRTEATAERGEKSNTAQLLGRAGMACYGVVHLVIAYLALQVAFGDSEQADQKGALEQIGSTAFGQVLLWIVAVGLILFGLWQFMMAATGYEWVSGGKRTRKRIGAAARGVVVIALGISAIRIATGSGGGSSNQNQQEFTAKLLQLPAGPALVVIAAACVLGVAIAAGVKGAKKKFLEDLNTTELPGKTKRWIGGVGTTGYLAKGVVLAVVAILLAIAGFQADPNKAGGLDAALKTLAAQPFGPVLLTVVALGLAAFGAYCFGAAWAHKR
ncbi:MULTISPECIES: DUF1206 domain-containing protein [unclassified Amycolatopsis]|uniref:DUF1206 domain-containing protein n=1 Tax=unclassified Amycolatopsis TaxID=2618356 RepID=UPI0028742139|nr:MULTISPECIES: DUF1206 domain-containing protein [unclassified Amycolatopsis]MDS0135137.1 DUF1206 domain-containing protein [Amycolatopsis sp. 505]MDS0143086.1 DUF1206 domain-containing protein [Amycolatopsis sp. CM201R]